MSIAAFQQSTKQVSLDAYLKTFQGEKDTNSIASLFASTFAPRFTSAIKSYVSQCIAPPPGGPIIPAPFAALSNDIVSAARDAFTQTFQGEKDSKGIANLFASAFSTVAPAVASYVAACSAVPGTPATNMLTIGGPLITSTPAMVKHAIKNAATSGMLLTFLGEPDRPGLSNKFGERMKDIADFFDIYMKTTMVQPKGGPLITT